MLAEILSVVSSRECKDDGRERKMTGGSDERAAEEDYG